MHRGTTPEYELIVDMDLTGWTCYVTLKWSKTEVTLEADRLDVTGGEQSTVRFSLSQEESLKFRPGKAHIQLRAIKDGVAVATDIATVSVGKILKDGEIVE